MVKLISRVRKTHAAPDSCYSEWRTENCTLVQSVTEGHLGQFHLGPRVVQDLPAPLERAEDAPLLLQPGFGAHIEPRAQNPSQNSDLTHLKWESIVLLSRENWLFFPDTDPSPPTSNKTQEKCTTLTVKGEITLHFFT